MHDKLMRGLGIDPQVFRKPKEKNKTEGVVTLRAIPAKKANGGTQNNSAK